MKRYNLCRTDDRYDEMEMIVDKDGEYVRYEDIEDFVSILLADKKTSAIVEHEKLRALERKLQEYGMPLEEIWELEQQAENNAFKVANAGIGKLLKKK